MRGLLPLIYLILGVVIAQQHDYLRDLDTLSDVISAALAITLWPLVLLDVSLRVHL